MRRTVTGVFCSLVLALGLAGCGGGGGGGGDGAIATIDIVGAQSLFIASSAVSASVSHGKATGDINKLFKITADGYVQEVVVEDAAGNQVVMNTNVPVGVYNVDSTYVIVVFGPDQINPSDSYLVRKSDGAAYKVNTAERTESAVPMFYYKNVSPVATDDNGNIYFDGYDGALASDIWNAVFKIADPATAPSITASTPETDSVMSFTVDRGGNVFYGAKLKSDSTVEVNRIKKLNGGLDNFEPYSEGYWKAADGNVYYLMFDQGSSVYQVKKVTFDSSYNVVESNYGGASPDPGLVCNPFESFLLNLVGRTLIVSSSGGHPRVVDVFNSLETPAVVDFSALFNAITTATASDSFYYLAGTDVASKGVLKECDPATHACSDLLIAGQYDIYSMVASNNGEVTFNALRMSDGAKIIAKVNDAGIVTVLDETLNAQVTMLERVN